jgi:serine/threonine protein kinase
MSEERDRDPLADAQGKTLTAWKPPGASGEQRRELESSPTVQSGPRDVPPGSDAGDPPALPVGTIVGHRYRIEEHISSGGFGAVYRATDREIRHHQVALKLLHRVSAAEAERESALRELMLIASVSHPSVVQFKDYGWHEGRLWFAMPWYRGQPLDKLLAGGAGLSRAEARPTFTQVAQALAAMHAVGVHHHDIKPENIFLAEIAGFPGGLPVLLDLGIATQRGENPRGLTVEYASPETAAAMLGEARHIGAAADVFSLALVLRNALDPAVAPAVRADDVLPALHQRATQPVALPDRRDLRYMQGHFKRWLSLDPAERPSASEFAEELRILTLPEETRRARLRILKRLVPVVLIAGLMITGLVLQLRKQKTVLSQREKQLTEERLVGEELRKQSEAQIEELEQQASTIGSEKKQLDQALAMARKLNEQLASASRRGAQLDKRLDALTGERDGLNADKQALTLARDSLTQDREKLTLERDALRSNVLRITGERDEAKSAQGRLQSQYEQTVEQQKNLEQRSTALEKQRDTLQASYDAITKKRDEAVAQASQQAAELEQLRADKKRLEKRITELEAQRGAATPEPATSAFKGARPRLPRPAP